MLLFPVIKQGKIGHGMEVRSLQAVAQLFRWWRYCSCAFQFDPVAEKCGKDAGKSQSREEKGTSL